MGKNSAFGGITLAPLALVVILGFVYISTYPGQSVMGLGFMSIMLAALVSFTMGLFLYMDFANPLWGFFGGIASFFVLLKVLAGLP